MNQRKDWLAYLAGLSAFLSVIENFIPSPIPLFRIGFSNIPVSFAITLFSFKECLFIVLFKVVFSHLFRGTLFSFPFLIALSGNLLMILSAYPFYHILKKRISFLSLSLIQSLFHNTGQILLSFLLLPGTAVLIFSLIMYSIGIITGIANGIVSNIIYNRYFRRYVNGIQALQEQ